MVDAANQQRFRYVVAGATMIVEFEFVNSSLIGVGYELRIKIPGGHVAASSYFTGICEAAGNLEEPAVIVTNEGDLAACLSVLRVPAAEWGDSDRGLSLRGWIVLEIASLARVH